MGDSCGFASLFMPLGLLSFVVVVVVVAALLLLAVLLLLESGKAALSVPNASNGDMAAPSLTPIVLLLVLLLPMVKEASTSAVVDVALVNSVLSSFCCCWGLL